MEQEPGGAEEGEDEDRETPMGAPVEVTRVGVCVPPLEENADLPGFHPERAHLLLQKVYGDFPHHIYRGAPRKGNRKRHDMAASLTPACCSVSNMVLHALRSGGAPLHGNLGRGMTGGSRQELELRETPCLFLRCSNKDVGHSQGPRDPGPANTSDGSLGEGSLNMPGWGRRGERGSQGVQG